MGCEGEAASSEVRVRGITLRGSIANNAPSICSGSAVNITAGTDGDGLTYDWTSKDNVGNIQSLGTAQTASKAAVIRDILTLKDNKRGHVAYAISPSNGDCMGALVSYSVFVNPVPVLTASPALDGICSGAKTAINLSVGLSAPESHDVTYAWQASENSVGAFSSTGNRTAFEQQTLTNRSAANAEVTYSFTASYNPGGAASPNCVSRPTVVRYSVSAPATASIGNASEKICVGDVITLTAFPQGLVYQWSKDGTPIDGAVNSSFLVPTGAASVSSYTVSVTNNCGSSTSAPKIANVSADAYFADAGITTGKSEGPGRLVNFSYTGPDADYLWDFGDHTIVNTKNASHKFLQLEAYHPILKVTKPGQPGCTKTFFFLIWRLIKRRNLQASPYIPFRPTTCSPLPATTTCGASPSATLAEGWC